MQHPLANPSLAPYGFTTPRSRARLDDKLPSGYPNNEKIMARMWARANCAKSPEPLPVKTIIHDILPAMAQRHRITTGDFQFGGLPYLSRDILVLSTFVQWFGTNCGWCFIDTDISKSWVPDIYWLGHHMFSSQFRYYHPEREFLIKLERDDKYLGNWGYKQELVIFLTHVCNSHCNTSRIRTLLGETCHYERSSVSARDRAVVEGLMRWLGQPAGRAFIAAYAARRKRANDAAWQRKKAEVFPLKKREVAAA